MDILNKNCGYYNFFPDMDDPDDDRTPEERVTQGCLAMLISFYLTIIICVVIGMMFSCSSSNSVMQTKKTDSTVVVVCDTVSVSRADSEVNHVQTIKHTQYAAVDTASKKERKTMEEWVMTFTDTLGQTTSSTHRKIDLNSSASSLTLRNAQEITEEIRTAIMLSRLDSILASYRELTQKHSSDSLNDTPTPVMHKKTSCWQKWKGWIYNGIMFVVLLVIFVRLLMSKNKDDGKD